MKFELYEPLEYSALAPESTIKLSAWEATFVIRPTFIRVTKSIARGRLVHFSGIVETILPFEGLLQVEQFEEGSRISGWIGKDWHGTDSFWLADRNPPTTKTHCGISWRRT